MQILMQRRWIFVCLILTFNTFSRAQTAKYSNEFLSIGVGAKAQAMGGAQVGLVNDITAGFWNPAGLTGMQQDFQFSFMHNEWFASIGQYDYVGLGAKLPDQNKYLGFSFIRFGVDQIPNTLSLYEADGSINYNNISEFNAADYAFMLHYAQEIKTLGLSLGITPKVIHRTVGPFAKSWGFGIDIGAQYHLKDFTFGLMLKDISTTFNSWSFAFSKEDKQTLELTGNEIPIKSMEITLPRIDLGVAYSKKFKVGKTKEGKKDKYIGLAAALDLRLTTDGPRNVLLASRPDTSSNAKYSPLSLEPVIGLEVNYNDLFFIRSGVNNIQQFEDLQQNTKWAIQPNFGLGFRLYNFYIDYALAVNGGAAVLNNNTEGSVLSHIVSLKLDINAAFIKKSLKEAS